jgi:four helix bundle protein
MKENIIQVKSFAFAVRIVKVYQYLCDEKKEYVLSKQLLRSGTSIGANIEEAIGGQSEKDFFAKLTIAYKEAREAHYWIRLLTETNYLTNEENKSLLNDVEELLKIIGSIQKTIRANHS